jgi:hypothetical protein
LDRPQDFFSPYAWIQTFKRFGYSPLDHLYGFIEKGGPTQTIKQGFRNKATILIDLRRQTRNLRASSTQSIVAC